MRLAGATLPDGRCGDVFVRDGHVTAGERPGAESGERPGAGSGESVDLSGYVLMAAPVEPHAHLDKALSWDAVGCGGTDLPGAIAAWSEWSRDVTVQNVRERALRALRILSGNGVTAVRTHVDLGRLEIVEALLDLRDDVRDFVDVQVVVLASQRASDESIRDALKLGVDLVGGCPHLADYPALETRRLMGLAEQAGVPLDLHTDERMEAAAGDLLDLARLSMERSFSQPVTASHCVRLGQLDRTQRDAVISEVANAGIGVVTLPLTNLYLQGRGSAASPSRGMTAVRALLDAGVPVAAGGDNLRDPFNPMGRGDPFEVASLLVTAGHLSVDEAYRAVTDGARAVLGLPAAGPVPGQIADLVAVRAGSLAEAIGAASQDRIVFRRGRVVSRTTVERHGFAAEIPLKEASA